MRKIVLVALAFAVGGLIAEGATLAATTAATKTLTLHMTGAQEVPKGSPTGSGSARLSLNSSTGQVCFTLQWSKIDAPTASHIHKGAKGKSGAVVVPLFAMAPAKHSGCVSASKALVAAILKKPTDYYVNLHTKQYPNGALRAQL
jgi:hypothetical protein